MRCFLALVALARSFKQRVAPKQRLEIIRSIRLQALARLLSAMLLPGKPVMSILSQAVAVAVMVGAVGVVAAAVREALVRLIA
jgi:hypothetical protein